MHWKPNILAIAPHMVGQADRHGRCAWRVALPQAFVGHDEVIEAHQYPDPPSMAVAEPGQAPGAAPQRDYRPSQRAIPPFHEGRLNRLPKLPKAQLFDKMAQATV